MLFTGSFHKLCRTPSWFDRVGKKPSVKATDNTYVYGYTWIGNNCIIMCYRETIVVIQCLGECCKRLVIKCDSLAGLTRLVKAILAMF